MTAGSSRLVLALVAIATALIPAACTRQAGEGIDPPEPGAAPSATLGTSVEPAASPAPKMREGQQSLAVMPGPADRRVGWTETQSNVAVSMVIRTGAASIEVPSLDAAIHRVRQLAERLGGYVGNTTTRTGGGQIRSATLELKIPAARFDEAVSGLSPFGKVESINVQAEDVGEEFVDLTARTTNAKRLEERLLALLAARTGKLEEVVNVERELARVREEIERFDGRLRYLRSRVATSTLTVTVHEPATLRPPRVGPGVMREAFRQAWRNGVEFVAVLIASLGWLVPLSLIATVVYVMWRRFGRRPGVPLPDAPSSPGI
jgi:hypothetical protein